MPNATHPRGVRETGRPKQFPQGWEGWEKKRHKVKGDLGLTQNGTVCRPLMTSTLVPTQVSAQAVDISTLNTLQKCPPFALASFFFGGIWLLPSYDRWPQSSQLTERDELQTGCQMPLTQGESGKCLPTLSVTSLSSLRGVGVTATAQAGVQRQTRLNKKLVKR